jgi:hypothetical protein
MDKLGDNYRGYFNKDGQYEGVGIWSFEHGIHYGEWHLGERHGLFFLEDESGSTSKLAYKNGVKDGSRYDMF